MTRRRNGIYIHYGDDDNDPNQRMRFHISFHTGDRQSIYINPQRSRRHDGSNIGLCHITHEQNGRVYERTHVFEIVRRARTDTLWVRMIQRPPRWVVDDIEENIWYNVSLIIQRALNTFFEETFTLSPLNPGFQPPGLNRDNSAEYPRMRGRGGRVYKTRKYKKRKKHKTKKIKKKKTQDKKRKGIHFLLFYKTRKKNFIKGFKYKNKLCIGSVIYSQHLWPSG